MGDVDCFYSVYTGAIARRLLVKLLSGEIEVGMKGMQLMTSAMMHDPPLFSLLNGLA